VPDRLMVGLRVLVPSI